MANIIAIHNGLFHADDAFCIALLNLMVKKEIMTPFTVVRTRDPEVIKTADFAVDVGGEYMPVEHRFDHHQRGYTEKHDNGIPCAAIGLLWRHYGGQLCAKYSDTPRDLWELIDEELIQSLDAADCGYQPGMPTMGACQVTTLSGVVAAFNTENIFDENAQYEAFMEAVTFCEGHLDRVLRNGARVLPDCLETRECLKNAKDGILVLPRGMSWKRTAYKEGGDDLKLVVFPSKDDQYNIQSLNVTIDSRDLRCPCPQKYRGCAPRSMKLGNCELEFAHASGFLGVVHAASLEEAVEAARVWKKEAEEESVVA